VTSNNSSSVPASAITCPRIIITSFWDIHTYIHSEPYVAGTDQKTNVNEHRIFQQLISRQQFGRVYLQHRYRIEERFIEDDFKMRFRYFLGLNVPLNKKEMVKDAIYLSLYNEIFLQDRDPVFNRDRIYGALGYVLNPYQSMGRVYATNITFRSSRAITIRPV